MIDAALPVLIGVLTIVAWFSAGVLVRAAWQRPRIGALSERAWIAVILALFGTVYTVAVVNTSMQFTLVGMEFARIVVRSFVVLLLLIPAYWTFLYMTGRLGGKR